MVEQEGIWKGSVYWINRMQSNGFIKPKRRLIDRRW